MQEIRNLWMVKMRLKRHDRIDHVYARDEQHAHQLARPLLRRHRCSRCSENQAELEACPFGFGTGSTFLPPCILVSREQEQNGELNKHISKAISSIQVLRGKQRE